MSYIKDFYNHNLRGMYLRRYPAALINLKDWGREIKWRHQRVERGWSDRDAWGGGEHIASVSAGILRELGNEKNIVDWDWYFRNNEWSTFGYHSLNDVAQDIENYLAWEELSYNEPIYNEYKDHNDTRWAIERQLAEDYKQGMRFVAENIWSLWW